MISTGFVVLLAVCVYAWQKPKLYLDKKTQLNRCLTLEAVDEVVILQLLRAALLSGVALPRALEAVGSCLNHNGTVNEKDIALATQLQIVANNLLLGASWQLAWQQNDKTGTTIAKVLEPAWQDGVNAEPLLAYAADAIMRKRKRELAVKAQKIGVKLGLPLAICFLPAFICISVFPLLLALAEKIFA